MKNPGLATLGNFGKEENLRKVGIFGGWGGDGDATDKKGLPFFNNCLLIVVAPLPLHVMLFSLSEYLAKPIHSSASEGFPCSPKITL
jgi:hypothetical protein